MARSRATSLTFVHDVNLTWSQSNWTSTLPFPHVMSFVCYHTFKASNKMFHGQDHFLIHFKTKKKKRCFTDKTKTKKRFADIQLHFFLPFPFICMIVLAYLFLQNMSLTMREWMHALVTTLCGAQVWNYYYYLKVNFARAWRTLGKLFQKSKVDGFIYDVIFCITR